MNTQIVLPLDEIAAVCRRYPIRKLALFGSVLHADFRDDSDVDVLVEFDPDARIGYFELVEIQTELSRVFGRPVDLLTPAALSRYFRQQVLDTAQVIYAKA